MSITTDTVKDALELYLNNGAGVRYELIPLLRESISDIRNTIETHSNWRCVVNTYFSMIYFIIQK